MTIRDDDPTIELNNKYTCICDVKKKKKKIRNVLTIPL